MEYHVSENGNDKNSGSKNCPFRTISKAADIVKSGDTVIVHEGIYRECVTIKKASGGGIVFTVADGENAVIKGSEEIKGWKSVGESLYKATIPCEFFGQYNPYSQWLEGDWFTSPAKMLHTGQVYINGKSLREVSELSDVQDGNWYCTVNDGVTEIYANFGDSKPEDNLIEINVRESCFRAECPGVNNITVSGFEMCHAATKWSPPTSEQSGLITANWCKGWIIENNHIHNSRCNGICIGKDKTGGDNPYTFIREKGGHLYQVESVFAGLQNGWSKDKVGSHLILNNTIHHCGQTGIVGHMGSAFCEIRGNHIYEIANMSEFIGDETGGIKLHAAIDTYIHENNIHNCIRAIWLDWQAQGARVSKNLFFGNQGEDLFIEVTHGPVMVDNNIFMSGTSIQLCSQGNACVHNLICGKVVFFGTSRNTPYHHPHSTEVKGFSFVMNGDDRYINNLFVPMNSAEGCGTSVYNGFNPSYESYMKERFEKAECSKMGGIMMPVDIKGNMYFGGSENFEGEENAVVSDAEFNVSICEEGGSFYLETKVPELDFNSKIGMVSGKNLRKALFSGEKFENPDGSEIVIDSDYFGNKRSKTPKSGPMENLHSGKILIWGKE